MSEQHHGRTRPEAPSELTDPLAGVLGVTRRRRRGASAQAEESEPLPRPRRQDLSDDWGGEVIVVQPEHWLGHIPELMHGLIEFMPLEWAREEADPSVPSVGPPPPGSVVISHAFWWINKDEETEATLREVLRGEQAD
jgi:hypothetical protein